MMTRIKIMILLAMVFPFNIQAAGDFSTESTVRYVLECMYENGGITDEALYYCTCKHDALAENISFSDYEEGVTYERNKPMPGEKGAVFRGIKRGQEMYDKLLKAREYADSQCTLVRKVVR